MTAEVSLNQLKEVIKSGAKDSSEAIRIAKRILQQDAREETPRVTRQKSRDINLDVTEEVQQNETENINAETHTHTEDQNNSNDEGKSLFLIFYCQKIMK